MVKGRKEDEGYSYLSDIDVSVQGQDANAACRTVVTAAQGLGVALDIGFMWRALWKVRPIRRKGAHSSKMD